MRLETVMKAAMNSTKTEQGRDQVYETQFAEDYAEPGYTAGEAGVAVGNWNAISQWNEKTRMHEMLDDTPVRLGKILEDMGYELEWEDEWTRCSDCDALVRTNPDSYCWQPSYVMLDGVVSCLECLDAEEHLKSLEGNAGTCNQLAGVDPADHDYMLIEEKFEHGFHRGMDADPKRIAKLLESIGVKQYLFNQDEQSQFYTTFSVWLHEDEKHLLAAAEEVLETGETDGPSVAAAMERGLEEAGRQTDKLRAQQAGNEGIIMSTVHGDGTASTRLVSPEDFVKGKA